ncbi:ATP-binding protein [Stackebrandtia nassauensis]|uniref:NB-ARC domain protein n=1 Tax=Stackebrandtia nassauensis (strain DSM 44728 / CIP 108903 / NRRL B-16338 / NBRC 102104 / LLR-40K-21) TaxID=446470 RepID=D3PWZ2_STANL|nr:ATP-binding protein [Stackebrandtia nassauensis]ADD45216.1 hypothetical protein Snas_5586 [Stackebrandtia nassauensis DSM 44728]
MDPVSSFFVTRWATTATDRAARRFSEAIRGTEVQRALVTAVKNAIPKAAARLHPDDDSLAGHVADCLWERDSHALPLVDGTALIDLADAVAPWVDEVYTPVGETPDAGPEPSLLARLLREEIIAAVRAEATAGDRVLHALWSDYQNESILRRVARPRATEPGRLDWGRLPLPGTFVGRREQLETLADMRSESGLGLIVSVGGFGGIGKTALASWFAASVRCSYPDGCVFVDFQSYPSPDQAVSSYAALGMLLEHLFGLEAATVARMDLAARGAEWQRRVAGKRMIFVWDNVSSIDQVEPLLVRDPDCLTLITSRERFHCAGSRTLDLDVLDHDAAVAMFVAVAGPRLAADEAAVSRVVTACGHMPVLIGLKAADIACGTGSLDRIEVQLNNLPSAHTKAGLYARIDSSYAALTAEQQAAYRLLGKHPGRYLTVGTTTIVLSRLIGRSVTVAEAVALLDGLVAHRLAEPMVTDPPASIAEQLAYTAHDILLDHAAGLPAATGEPEILSTVCDYYADRLAHYDFVGDLAWFRTERSALVAALTSPAARPHATLNLAQLMLTNDNIGLAIDILRELLDGFVATGDSRGEVNTLQTLGQAVLVTGDHEGARDLFTKAGHLAEEHGFRDCAAHAYLGLAQVKALNDSPVGIADMFERALDIFVDLDDVTNATNALAGMAQVAMLQQDFDAARSIFVEIEDTSEVRAYGMGVALGVLGQAHVAYLDGDNDEAIRLYQRGEEASESVGYRFGVGMARECLGEIAAETGDVEGAIAHFRGALTVYVEIGSPSQHEVREALRNLGVPAEPPD